MCSLKKKKSGYKQFLIVCKILTSSAFGESDDADKSDRYIIIKLLITWILVLVSIYNSSQPPTLGLIWILTVMGVLLIQVIFEDIFKK